MSRAAKEKKQFTNGGKKKKKELTSVGCNVNISCGFSLSTLTINKSLTEIIFMHLPILSKFYPDNYHISKLFKKKKLEGRNLKTYLKYPRIRYHYQITILHCMESIIIAWYIYPTSIQGMSKTELSLLGVAAQNLGKSATSHTFNGI